MEFYMLVLALDTTTRGGSVALARDGVVLESDEGNQAATHGERLPGDLIRVLDRRGLGVGDVDLFAVAAGPGSFTGLRIGIATMQGLAFANGKSVVGVSALDALHHLVQSMAELPPATVRPSIATWMDAHRGEVFSALYDGGAVLDGPSAEKPSDILQRWRPRFLAQPIIFGGDGAIVYAGLIAQTLPDARVVATLPPLAPSIAHLALDRARTGELSPPDSIRPIYVRRPDAELARDRKVIP
jgi:tRNA threonylcarbamoyladenosine biosynthesis protein TsaB